jgi:hypothetical protein
VVSYCFGKVAEWLRRHVQVVLGFIPRVFESRLSHQAIILNFFFSVLRGFFCEGCLVRGERSPLYKSLRS